VRKLIVLLAVAVSGCAVGGTVWVKDGGTQQGFEQDRATCAYEAEMGVSGYGTAAGARGVTGAAAQGFAEGLAAGMRKNELYRLCMGARGYRPQGT
jgi:uncharacterized protein YceK